MYNWNISLTKPELPLTTSAALIFSVPVHLYFVLSHFILFFHADYDPLYKFYKLSMVLYAEFEKHFSNKNLGPAYLYFQGEKTFCIYSGPHQTLNYLQDPPKYKYNPSY